MKSSVSSGRSCAVFLFAHQDDEFGIWQHIQLEQGAGRRVFCLYLTDGGQPARRNAESLAVLKGCGVAPEDVLFVGDLLQIADGQLPQNLERAAQWLNQWLGEQTDVRSVYLPAWEGGHPDHDALHAFALTVLSARAYSAVEVNQFSLYHACGCPGPFFRVCAPLQENGPVRSARIPWSNRLRFIRYAASGYPSQWRSWLGLLPFYAMHCVLDGREKIQKACLKRTTERPHKGRLYYEKRAFSDWQTMSVAIQKWRQAWLPEGE